MLAPVYVVLIDRLQHPYSSQQMKSALLRIMVLERLSWSKVVGTLSCRFPLSHITTPIKSPSSSCVLRFYLPPTLQCFRPAEKFWTLGPYFFQDVGLQVDGLLSFKGCATSSPKSCFSTEAYPQPAPEGILKARPMGADALTAPHSTKPFFGVSAAEDTSSFRDGRMSCPTDPSFSLAQFCSELSCKPLIVLARRGPGYNLKVQSSAGEQT
ncbi:hypothetical protein C8R44DRAFT_384402 [Mycena epipterygia]|nr:hypothetical protein C8R44DRAFT_384402 [Mycena epipterygia]